MYILGINESHVATAALLYDGEVVACASEERFTRKKGGFGFPRQAILYCMKQAGIGPDQIDRVVIGFENPGIILHGLEKEAKTSMNVLMRTLGPWIMSALRASCSRAPWIYSLYEWLYVNLYQQLVWPHIRHSHILFLSRELGIPKERIIFINHHVAHGYGAYYSYHRDTEEPHLVIVNDGIGDDVCGTVFTVHNNEWQVVATTPNRHSLAYIYQYTTQILGMKPNEHEYKVMGLAPYASRMGVDVVYPIFQDLIVVRGNSFYSRIPTLGYYSYLRNHLKEARFDAIAGAAQQLVEERLSEQMRNIVKSTGITKVAAAGGIFMNIKANKELNALPEVSSFTVMPSSGDESTAIGACYYGYVERCRYLGVTPTPRPLTSLYLGPEYSDADIDAALRAEGIYDNRGYRVIKVVDSAQTAAEILARGIPIARFSGRMEFGARSLGNRSILAPANNAAVIRQINEQIKGRDFWMPFAPSILAERAHDYLVDFDDNPSAAYMMMGYATTPLARTDLIAALHPYDYTARPQIVTKDMNPGYYDVLKAFETLTGCGGILNTSFNIHGEPVVCSPRDALHTLEQSGMTHLMLDNYLIEKVE